MLKLYVYQGCSTCRDAMKWLKAKSVAFQEIPIRETPPGIPDLEAMLAAKEGDLRKLFNSSGMDYRAMNLKDKLPAMTQNEALALLSSHGNLVKRPFALDPEAGVFLLGFKEKEWQAAFA